MTRTPFHRVDTDGGILTVFDDGILQVRVNPCGEVFVSNKRAGRCPTIRVNPRGEELSITAHSALMTPYAVNGLPAFIVH